MQVSNFVTVRERRVRNKNLIHHKPSRRAALTDAMREGRTVTKVRLSRAFPEKT